MNEPLQDALVVRDPAAGPGHARGPGCSDYPEAHQDLQPPGDHRLAELRGLDRLGLGELPADAPVLEEQERLRPPQPPPGVVPLRNADPPEIRQNAPDLLDICPELGSEAGRVEPPPIGQQLFEYAEDQGLFWAH